MQDGREKRRIKRNKKVKDGGIKSGWHLSRHEGGLGPQGFDLLLHSASTSAKRPKSLADYENL